MRTPNDRRHYATPDEQECPTCGTGHFEPPDHYNGAWYQCEICEAEGCDSCFMSAKCCADCYKEED